MAPRRTSSHQQNSDAEEYDGEDYRKKRDRNNQAVKKSRFKSKQKTQETLDRIETLKNENKKLEDKVREKTKELGILKELFVANGNLEGVDLEKLLEDDPDDEETTT
ncbi:inverted repeat binding protein 18 kDa [Arctopsyche grandis]|uniref:inverted repeat binding protein 18 kDa n=1 Tax=Arctopsyche grandis TaxID=121162 RepID=UPI00406D935E